jgi:hypothetical protein
MSVMSALPFSSFQMGPNEAPYLYAGDRPSKRTDESKKTPERKIPYSIEMKIVLPSLPERTFLIYP